jgi:hypothetical protein
MDVQSLIRSASRTASRRTAQATDQRARSVALARLAMANKDTFFLRTLPVGYDWIDPDPDRLLPGVTSKSK